MHSGADFDPAAVAGTGDTDGKADRLGAPQAASFGALGPTFGDRSRLEALESVTSGRLQAEQRGVPTIAPEAMASGYGYTYINAAFAYPRLAGSRFNPPQWGAWLLIRGRYGTRGSELSPH